MDFSKLLKRFMNRTGMTEYGIAKLCGVSAPTINRWMNEKYLPKLETVEKMCTAAGVSLSEFFEEDQEITLVKPNNPSGEGYDAAITKTKVHLSPELAEAFLRASEDQADRRKRLHDEIDRLLDIYESKDFGK